MAVVERLGGCCHGATYFCSEINKTEEKAEGSQEDIVRTVPEKNREYVGASLERKQKAELKP